MRTVGISQARTHLSALIRVLEENGEDIDITRNGHRAVRLVRIDDEGDVPAQRSLGGDDLVAKFRELQDASQASKSENASGIESKKVPRR